MGVVGVVHRASMCSRGLRVMGQERAPWLEDAMYLKALTGAVWRILFCFCTEITHTHSHK
jgi:hypothetical protein